MRLRRLLAREGGATAVEFSLIATLLFMLLFGILQFGLTYNRQQGMHHAAREAARLASLGNDVDHDDVVARVIAALPAFITEPATDVDVLINGADPASDPAFCVAAGDIVTIAVGLTSAGESKYQIRIPLIPSVFPDLDVEAEFRCESARTGP